MKLLKKQIKSTHLLNVPNGVILYGPPGNGKTMFAKAMAYESKCNFINLCPSTFESQYHGESIKLLKGCFDLASKLKPCIIFLDELDGFLSQRNDFDQSHVNSIKTMFLSLMDGFNTRSEQVLVIGATNRLKSLDKASLKQTAFAAITCINGPP